MRRSSQRFRRLKDSGIGELAMPRVGIAVRTWSLFMEFGIPQSLNPPMSGGRG